MSSARIMPLTEARLKEPPMQSLIDAVYIPGLERETDPQAFQAHVWVDLAHATMLTEQGLIPTDAAKRLLECLLLLRQQGPSALQIDPALGSLVPQIEQFIAVRAGQEAAGMLQLARSRIDGSAAVMRVGTREPILATIEAVLEFQDVLRDRAAEWADVIMPGYSHLQHAQPWVLGHYLLSHYDSLARDVERLFELYRRVDLSTLGTAALAGTSWPVDRRRAAVLLGHPDLVLNSQDAGCFEMDFLAEAAASLSILMSGLGRLASELYIWNSWEFRMVEMTDGLCGTSSIMPQ
ncbi:MAG: lyase family protein, partial [Nevskiales bacterium]